ncbi:MAG: tail fiber domain-containing protein, partial [Flavobacteriales bacterium]|nr:tail fiber domain-containing protein [Flavobacteriales bacterium]
NTDGADAILIQRSDNTHPASIATTDFGKSLIFKPGGSETVRFTNGGNVGIGTTSPAGALEIELPGGGVNLVLDKATTDAQISFREAGISKWNLYLEASTDKFHIRDDDASVNRMTVDNSGNVGIGTTSPASRLQIAGGGIHLSTADNTLRIYSNTDGADAILIQRSDNTHPASIATTDLGKSLIFKPGGSETVRFTNVGNVGIGTTSPQQKVHAYGTGDPFGGYRRSNTAGATLILSSSRDNVGADDVLVSGDALGRVLFRGYDGTDFISEGADILAYVDGTPGIDDMPGRLEFRTTPDGTANALTRMTIKNNGNVGIGTTSPGSKLHVHNTAAVGHLLLSANDNPTADATRIDLDFQVTNTGHTVGRVASFYLTSTGGGSGGLRFYTRNTGTLAERVRITSAGNVGIGTTTPTQRLTVFNGTTTGTYTTTGWVHSSDAILKTNVKPIGNSLDKVMALNGVYFNWVNIPDSNKQMGFIAQEVAKIIPEVVVKDTDGKYGMAYGNLTALLVNAIKEQQKMIEELKAENNTQRVAMEEGFKEIRK